MTAGLRGDGLVGYEIGQEGGAHGGREAHVAGLHRRRLQCEYLVPGALQCNVGVMCVAACLDPDDIQRWV